MMNYILSIMYNDIEFNENFIIVSLCHYSISLSNMNKHMKMINYYKLFLNFFVVALKSLSKSVLD